MLHVRRPYLTATRFLGSSLCTSKYKRTLKINKLTQYKSNEGHKDKTNRNRHRAIKYRRTKIRAFWRPSAREKKTFYARRHTQLTDAPKTDATISVASSEWRERFVRFFIPMFLLFCIFVLFSSPLLSFVVIRFRCVFGVVRLMRRPFLSLRLASDSNTASSRTGALSCGRRKVRERKTESEERSKETYTSGETGGCGYKREIYAAFPSPEDFENTLWNVWETRGIWPSPGVRISLRFLSSFVLFFSFCERTFFPFVLLLTTLPHEIVFQFDSISCCLGSPQNAGGFQVESSREKRHYLLYSP